MNKKSLTLEEFNKIPFDGIIAEGEDFDNETGLFLCGTGEKLKWIAKKGSGNDWAIYAHFAAKPSLYILSNGVKVCDERNIKKLVPCDDAVYKKYRR